jgi:hypothetical protein
MNVDTERGYAVVHLDTDRGYAVVHPDRVEHSYADSKARAAEYDATTLHLPGRASSAGPAQPIPTAGLARRPPR